MKFVLLVLCLAFPLGAFAEKRSITLVNYETDGVKQWLPGTIMARKGDVIEITLINNVVSGIHGFFIPDYKVRKEVKKGTKEVVTFTADKEGLFTMKCHLHPAHVGGQLLVLP
jgi:nitrosocyanin